MGKRGVLSDYSKTLIGDLWIESRFKGVLSHVAHWNAECRSEHHDEPEKLVVSSVQLRKGMTHCGCRGLRYTKQTSDIYTKQHSNWKAKIHPATDLFLKMKF